jgi:hypothetical protein
MNQLVLLSPDVGITKEGHRGIEWVGLGIIAT